MLSEARCKVQDQVTVKAKMVSSCFPPQTPLNLNTYSILAIFLIQAFFQI